jgi:hypothetical protein
LYKQAFATDPLAGGIFQEPRKPIGQETAASAQNVEVLIFIFFHFPTIELYLFLKNPRSLNKENINTKVNPFI